MKCKWTVTFEYDENSPETVQGEIEASEVQTIGHRALMAAKSELPNRRWRSLVLLLQKLD
jgi:hypothetical protein